MTWLRDLLTPTCPPGLSPQGLQNCQDFLGPHPFAHRVGMLVALLVVLIVLAIVHVRIRSRSRSD